MVQLGECEHKGIMGQFLGHGTVANNAATARLPTML